MSRNKSSWSGNLLWWAFAALVIYLIVTGKIPVPWKE